MWRDKEEEAEAVFVKYFGDLFSTNGDNDEMSNVLDAVQPKVRA